MGILNPYLSPTKRDTNTPIGLKQKVQELKDTIEDLSGQIATLQAEKEALQEAVNAKEETPSGSDDNNDSQTPVEIPAGNNDEPTPEDSSLFDGE